MSSSTSSSERASQNFGHYLLVLALGAMGLLAQVVVPNVLVDPYWYFGGGHLAGLRYPFSTRDAKINRLSSGLPDHDCLISGSSRSLTLDPTAFERHRCFNLAVEGATLSESVELASRFARLATPPRLVLQAIDRFAMEPLLLSMLVCRVVEGHLNVSEAFSLVLLDWVICASKPLRAVAIWLE